MALTKKKITVRSKSGKTFQRSVMVRAGDAVKRVGRFVSKHKGAIAAGAAAAALAGGAIALNKHKILGAGRGAGLALNAWRHSKVNGESMGIRDRLKSIAKGAHAGAVSNSHMDAERVGAAHGRLAAAFNRGVSHVQGAINRRADSVKGTVAAASPPPPPSRPSGPKAKAKKRK
jgi:hypothetical protein